MELTANKVMAHSDSIQKERTVSGENKAQRLFQENATTFGQQEPIIFLGFRSQ